jgi:hypothetical protein
MSMTSGLTKFLIIAVVLLSAWDARSQYDNVVIYSEQVGGIGPCEPAIFINPKSPNKMVVSMVSEKTMQTSGTKTGSNKIYFSKDFGRSWLARNVKSKFGDFGDPCIIADNEGYFYYFHMSDPQKLGWEGSLVMDRIVCQRSVNGKSWNKGVSIGHNPPKKHEKPWAAFNETSGSVIVAWTQYDQFNSVNPLDSAHIMVSISNNRGLSWTPAIRVNEFGGDCNGALQTPTGAVPTAGPEQDIYVTWAYDESIYFDRSIDGGITWLKRDKVVADQPGGWHFDVPGFSKGSGVPVNACDISYGIYHGNIYVVWADQRNGATNTDIWIAKSTDRGDSWTDPARVNDDPLTGLGKHQCFSWVSVDPITGIIYVVFYDRRNYDDMKTDVYMAYSSDGGDTFVNEKISQQPFEPDDDVYMGDYINIVSYGGFVRPIWTELSNGKLQIVTAIIDQN